MLEAGYFNRKLRLMVINMLKITEDEVGNLERDLKSLKGNCRTKRII